MSQRRHYEVGDLVMLSSDPEAVKASFREIDYVWVDQMIPLCGKEYAVLEVRRKGSRWIIGLSSPDGTQDGVWYYNESVVTFVRSKSQQAMVQRYAVAFAKGLAGAVRFFLEDGLQGMCQTIFLIKRWREMTLASKAFTMGSISAGVMLSLLVPLKESLVARNVIQSARQSDPSLVQEMSVDRDNKNTGLAAATTALMTRAPREDRYGDGYMVLRDMGIVEYLQGTGANQKHVRTSHVALVTSAGLFWSAMLMLLFTEPPDCDGHKASWTHMAFLLLCVFDFLAQAFVMLHSKQGYNLLMSSPALMFLGTFFTVVGHFDTYADVTFTGMVSNCEPITWFSIRGRVFHLPFELQKISLVTLVLGVFCFQAVPAMIMLINKKWLPIAFKMNEFNLLLVQLEMEGQPVERTTSLRAEYEEIPEEAPRAEYEELQEEAPQAEYEELREEGWQRT